MVEEDDGIFPSSGELLAAHTISVTVPTSQIRPGDSVLVLPGETIPVDVSLNTIFKDSVCGFVWSSYALAEITATLV